MIHEQHSAEEIRAALLESVADVKEVASQVTVASPVYTVEVGKVCPIGPVTVGGVTFNGAIDMRQGDIGLSEMSVRRQFVGGLDAANALKEQGQAALEQEVADTTFPLKGAKLGFTVDSEFFTHPIYEDPEYQLYIRLVPSFFGQSFQANLEVLGVDDTSDKGTLFKILKEDFEWVTPDLGGGTPPDGQGESRSTMIWHLAPPTTATTDRGRAIERSRNAIPVLSFEYQSTLREDEFHVLVGFSNPVEAWTKNIKASSVMMALATNQIEQTAAMRMAYSWTGVKGGNNGPRQYPERASVSVFELNTGSERRPHPLNFDLRNIQVSDS